MRLVMMGTGTFAEPTFRALLTGPHPVVGLVTQPDRPAGQERGSTRQTGPGMAEIARAHQIPIIQPESVNTPEGVAGVKAFQPDLLVVAAYGQILSNEVLSAASQGGINIHASLLPRYRGAAPVAWAIYHGETRTGVSIIKMSVYLDAGDILAQEALDIGSEETAGELEVRLAPLGARLAMQVIDQIAAGTAHGVKQDKSLATKAPKLTKEHGQIDWSRPVVAVCNQIRAMQPWPTAYTFFHREGKAPTRLIVSKATFPADFLLCEFDRSEAQKPGTIMRFPSPERLWVATGDELSFVEILELQPAGKKRMSAAEFLRGHAIRPGDHLGPEQE